MAFGAGRTAALTIEHPSSIIRSACQTVDLTRADFAAIADDLDFIKARLARIPTRKELARIALGVIFAAAGLAIVVVELFWRHCCELWLYC